MTTYTANIEAAGDALIANSIIEKDKQTERFSHLESRLDDLTERCSALEGFDDGGDRFLLAISHATASKAIANDLVSLISKSISNPMPKAKLRTGNRINELRSTLDSCEHHLQIAEDLRPTTGLSI